MKSEKLRSSSDSSSEDTDEQEVQDDSCSTGAKRSYECTFCRRGFTNAQALGGHMNIHRKDRAKAKQQGTPNSNSSPPNKFTNEESMMIMAPPFFIPEISSQASTAYYSMFEPQTNYDIHFQPSVVPNPRYPPAYAFQYDQFINPRVSQSLNSNQELMSPNLSLSIGPSHHVDTDQVRRGIQNDGEVVDLELRLGHDPYSNY